MGNSTSLGQYSTTPIYNTKAVARETQVPADTFRAWERRYGVPRPERTAGGHRLYSERDIAIIRWLRDRTAEGMNISQAVMLLMNSLSSTLTEQPPVPQPMPLDEPRNLRQIVEEVVGLLTSFDAAQAERVLSEAFAMHPFEQVLLHIVQPTMVEIGERWHRGEINVAAEHFATQFVRRKLSSLLNMFDAEASNITIVMACAPNELHDLGALLTSLFMVRRGWHVIYLGPQVPLNDLLETVQELAPDLVCLSASLPETALQLAEVARVLHSTFPHLLIGYGGRVFNKAPEVRASISGTFLGEDAREVIDTIALLLSQGSTSAVGL